MRTSRSGVKTRMAWGCVNILIAFHPPSRLSGEVCFGLTGLTVGPLSGALGRGLFLSILDFQLLCPCPKVRARFGLESAILDLKYELNTETDLCQ